MYDNLMEIDFFSNIIISK